MQLIPKKKIEHYIYVMTDPIGQGFSSKVYKGKDENTGEIVAVKVIDMKAITNEIERSLVFQEINALKVIQSPNVIKMYDYYLTNNNTYIITEFCAQGDLGQQLKQGPINEVEACKILRHIINGFRDQIKKGVIHRDIKPSNILIKNGVPKLADYGLSKMAKGVKEKVYFRVGTPVYMSPESFLESKYSEKSDIWSIGVMYYEMLYGSCPWQITQESEFTDSVSQLSFPRNVPVSEDSKEFLRKALEIDESQRINLSDIELLPLFNRRNTTTLVKPRTILQSNSFNKSVTSLNNALKVNQTQQAIRNGSISDLHPQHKTQKSTQFTRFFDKVATIIPHTVSALQFDTRQEEIIINTLNHCQFLYRMSQLLSQVKSQRIQSFVSVVGKDCLGELTKLKEAYDRGVNLLQIPNFSHQQALQILNRLNFRDLYNKYRDFFKTSESTINLTMVIRELNHMIRLEFSDANVLLLDYLVVYYQLVERKEQNLSVEGRPNAEITQSHYQEIRLKIFNLGI